jgi:pimeloyl-ACP methyl ester carboxylesterase
MPEMPWSGGRIYDQSYEAAMTEIDDAINQLRARGAKKVFVAGHSLGANAALHYATRTSVDGVLALAPGHVPDQRGFQDSLADSLQRAKNMVRDGKGDEKAIFDDNNQGERFTVQTTAKIYLSYMDSEGPAVIPKSAAALKPGTPLLWVVGTRDGMYKRGSSYAFDKAPPHPKSKYVVINSDHRGTPADARNEIIAWLRDLRERD